jgi:hypothetical protein
MINNNIEGFHNTWNLVISELETRPDEKLLQYLYFNQLKNFKPLEADIAFYRRAEWNNGPEFCFQWLWDSACRYITQVRQDYMQDALSKSLADRHSSAAPAPQGRGKGTPDRKGKAPRDGSATSARPPKGRGRGQPKGVPRGRSADKDGKGKDTPNKNVCFAFQKGTCTRGAACGFSHDKERGRSPSTKPKPAGKSKKQCSFFIAGTCKFGENVTTCTVAVAEALPPKEGGRRRANLKEDLRSLLLRSQCQLDPQLLS